MAVTPALASNPGVLPPDSTPHGASYGEWGARWWQWTDAIPAVNHPLAVDDMSIDRCAVGQQGNVWFLGGKVNISATNVNRRCTIPSGTFLFFPVLNAVCFDPLTAPPVRTEAQLRARCTEFMDAARDMLVEINGRSLEDLGLDSSYRVSSDIFYETLPEPNRRNLPAGTYGPMVTEGYYIMLAPLRVGEHTVRFAGRLGPPFNFALDITYHITVVPRGQYGR
jgi:hypothetical protein